MLSIQNKLLLLTIIFVIPSIVGIYILGPYTKTLYGKNKMQYYLIISLLFLPSIVSVVNNMIYKKDNKS